MFFPHIGIFLYKENTQGGGSREGGGEWTYASNSYQLLVKELKNLYINIHTVIYTHTIEFKERTPIHSHSVYTIIDFKIINTVS